MLRNFRKLTESCLYALPILDVSPAYLHCCRRDDCDTGELPSVLVAWHKHEVKYDTLITDVQSISIPILPTLNPLLTGSSRCLRYLPAG